MPYEEQKWVENITAANEAHLNHIEKGIIAEEAARIAQVNVEETRALNAEKAAREAAEAEATAKDNVEKARAEAAEALKIPLTQKGKPSGVAELEAAGKVPSGQLPALSINEVFTSASQAEMLATPAHTGDVDIRTDVKKQFILTKEPATVLGNWAEFTGEAGAVSSVNSKVGAVTLTAVDVAADKEGEAKTEETRAKAAEKLLEEHTAGLAGGVATQALFKKSSAAYDFEWKVPSGGGGSGLTRVELEELQGIAYVADFGAKGDGVTNDTAAFTSAIASLPTAGGVLYLTAGKNYLVTEIILKSNVTVIGYGATVTQKAGEFHGTIKVPPFTSIKENVKVYGVRVVSGGSTNSESSAFEFSYVKDVIIRDCIGEKFKGAFFTGEKQQRVAILNNTAIECVKAGSANVIDVLNDGTANDFEAIVTGNFVFGGTGAGIAVATLKGVTGNAPLKAIVANNVVENTGSFAGIVVESGGPATSKPKAWDILIANNHVNCTATADGIIVSSNGEAGSRDEETSANVVITGNRIKTVSNNPILITGRRMMVANNIITVTTKGPVILGFPGGAILSREIAFIDNIIQVPTTYESTEVIQAVNLAESTISGNRITFDAANTHTSAGIAITVNCHDLDVERNTIVNATHYGVSITSVYKNCKLVGNTITNTGQGAIKGVGINIAGEATGTVNLIAHNVIVDNRGGSALTEFGLKTVGTGTKEVLLNNIVYGQTSTITSGTFIKFSEISAHVAT